MQTRSNFDMLWQHVYINCQRMRYIGLTYKGHRSKRGVLDMISTTHHSERDFQQSLCRARSRDDADFRYKRKQKQASHTQSV